MTIRLVASLFLVAFPAHGRGPCDCSPSSAKHGPFTPSPSAEKQKQPTPPRVEYGTFVYKSDGPERVKVTFNATKCGDGMLTVQCGGNRYQNGWFRLGEKTESTNVYLDTSHAVARPCTGTSVQQEWIQNIEAVCPKLSLSPREDLDNIYNDDNGNAVVIFLGQYTVLKRRWLRMIPGVYESEHRYVGLELYYGIEPSGRTRVKFGCKGGGDTGYKTYRLKERGPGEPYELTPVPGGATVKDLIDSYKQACPRWIASAESARGKMKDEDFITVGFATSELLYAFGQYPYERLKRVSTHR
ncbi:hypothetical protein FOZ60_004087 [Perkinsus olseni]|uniref:Uncharacterized protein n=1 Tax=Perkinsus olseni TaxID=32597 RepID=A0A7J6PJ64_PEROL|nr:hypothetical protein FOZ60_004087 [Perkinsus olseni]